MDIDLTKIAAFETPPEFAAWLAGNHATANELWLKMYRKSSGVASVTWEQAVIEALAWGWIDGLKKSGDEQSWFQRFTPRKPKSLWSQKNRTHAERLIAEGRMQEAGMRAVNEAKADGRWQAAYATGSEIEIPQDFLAELQKYEKAEAAYGALNRSRLFAIYYRLHTAKTELTRQRRMARIINDLATKGTID